MALKTRIPRKNQPVPGEAEIISGTETLCINCGGCQQFPDAGSPGCINCICSSILEHGAADKIVLRSGKDTEISGPAAEILCDLARLNRPVSIMPGGRRCSRCPRSPERILEGVWAEFPEPSFHSSMSRLYCDGREGPECTACLQRTYSMLASADEELEKIKQKTARAAVSREVSI